MAITKEDIQNEGFEHSLRGYDVEQVDMFLDRVAKEVDVLNTRIVELEAEVKQKTEELGRLRDEASAATASPDELEEATAREQETRAELEEAQGKIADAILRAEEAERRVNEAEVRAKAAEEKLAPLEEQLAEKSKLDSAIAEAFISAQRSADQLKEDARIEGDRIYRESEAKAREFIRESLAKKASVNKEIEALQESVEKFKSEYIDMLNRFTDQAKSEFADIDSVLISDEEIRDALPNIEDMPGLPEEEQEPEDAAEDTAAQAKLSDSDIPQIGTQPIPTINIPPVYPEN